MANVNENVLTVKFKKLHPDAKVPVRMRQGDGAYDLSCIGGGIIDWNRVVKFNTGIAVSIPEGYVGLLWSRGGLGMKGCDVHGGVIDSNFRGEIIVGLSNHDTENNIIIAPGDRVAQLIIQKSEEVDFVEVDELEDTNRNTAGFGSSDYLKQYNNPIQG